MKAIGKIGVLIITFMVVASIFLFINIETYGIDGGMRFGGFQLLLIIGIPWFISYSKWANDNIWNKKSYTSNTEVIESKDDNEEVLETIDNVLNNPENDDEETSLKIEELKKQIESLEESLNKKDSNSQDKGYKKVKNKYDYSAAIIGFFFILTMTIVGIYLSESNNIESDTLNKVELNKSSDSYKFPLFTKRQKEKALKENHLIFKKDGYNGSLQKFKELMKTNSEAVEVSYKLARQNSTLRGFSNSNSITLEEYKSLMGYVKITYTESEKNSALKLLYPMFKNEGYEGSFKDFEELMKTNLKAVKVLYTIAKEDDYNRSLEDFKSLVKFKKYE